MPTPNPVLLVIPVLHLLCACTIAPPSSGVAEDSLFPKPLPEFPVSELTDAREGWVHVGYVSDKAGFVSDVHVRASSGNPAFEKAAVEAVEQWRHKPGEAGELSVLVNFVLDRNTVLLSRRFMSLNDRIHRSLDDEDLESAAARLDEIRADEDLTPFELAYSYLTEGRIHGMRGDRAAQLRSFRLAMLNEGRWLARENYLATLRAAIILGIQEEDFASAIRDYDLLVQSGTGRRLANDLDEAIESLRSRTELNAGNGIPFAFADRSVSVRRELINVQLDTSPPREERAPRPRPPAARPPNPQ